MRMKVRLGRWMLARLREVPHREVYLSIPPGPVRSIGGNGWKLGLGLGDTRLELEKALVELEVVKRVVSEGVER